MTLIIWALAEGKCVEFPHHLPLVYGAAISANLMVGVWKLEVVENTRFTFILKYLACVSESDISNFCFLEIYLLS